MNHVQGRTVSNAAAPTGTAIFLADVTAGSLLFAAIRLPDETTTVSSVTDSLGQTWTLFEGPLDHPNTTFRVYVYYKQNSAGGTAPTVTFNLSASVSSFVGIGEFSGEAGSGAEDAIGLVRPNGAGSSSSSATTHTTNGVNLSAAGGIISWLVLNSTQTITPAGSETNVTGGSSRVHLLFTAHASSTTGTTHSATTGAGSHSTQGISSWLNAGGGGGGNRRRRFFMAA